MIEEREYVADLLRQSYYQDKTKTFETSGHKEQWLRMADRVLAYWVSTL